MFTASRGTSREDCSQIVSPAYKGVHSHSVSFAYDWSVAIAVEYKSWSTQDEMAEKAAGISEKHYGSRQAMMEAAKKRNEIAPTLSSSLAREVTLK